MFRLKLMLKKYRKPAKAGTANCFHCGGYQVVWDNDFSFEDFGYEGEGIVHMCHCCNCGADIEYRVRLED